MTATKVTAPFGTWPSPITAGMIVDTTISLSSVLVDGHDIYWLEGRPSEGRLLEVRLIEGRPGEVRPGEGRPCEGRLIEDRPPHVHLGEVRPSEVRPLEARLLEVRPGFDRVAVDFHGSHVTSRSTEQPEGPPGCCQGVSLPWLPTGSARRRSLTKAMQYFGAILGA